MTNLNKKLVITVNLKNLSETNFVKKTAGMAAAAQSNPTIVPALSPTATVVTTKIQALSTMLVQRDNMVKSQKQLTEQIIVAEKDITNIITSQWAPYVQQTIAGDASKAKLLGYGIKGEDDGEAEEEEAMAVSSHPDIMRIDLNVHLQHTLHIVNSQSGLNKLPMDAKQIDIYVQIGGTKPADIKQMTYLGIAKRGKFVNNFDVADLGKTVYYIAVYIDRKTLKPLELSPVDEAIIN